MDYSDDRLQHYINKVQQMQDKQHKKLLTEQECKKLALEIGLNEKDWQVLQENYQVHLRNGKEHLAQGDWSKAIQELQQAKAISPRSFEATQGLAKAHMEEWKLWKNPRGSAFVKEFINAALDIQPEDSTSINMLEDFIRLNKDAQNKAIYFMVGIMLSVLVLIYALVIFEIIPNSKKSMAKRWAETIKYEYQDRADLLPEMIRIAQTAGNFEEKIIQKLKKASKKIAVTNPENFSRSEIVKFEQHQTVIRSAIDDFFAAAKQRRELTRELEKLCQKVSFKEQDFPRAHKRFYEKVGSYNNLISSFPGLSLFIEKGVGLSDSFERSCMTKCSK